MYYLVDDLLIPRRRDRRQNFDPCLKLDISQKKKEIGNFDRIGERR